MRALQQKEELSSLLQAIQNANENHQPLLLKISPDVTRSELESILRVSLDHKIDGWILTNTTTSRPTDSNYPQKGGLSGEFLKNLSLQKLNETLAILGSDRQGKLLVSAGGILTSDDVNERLDKGADLIQVYAALVFQGPHFFEQVIPK